METRRMILATVLSIAVVILFTQVIIPRSATRRAPPNAPASAAKAPAPAVPAAPAPAAPAVPGFAATPAQTEEILDLKTAGFRARVTSRGAALLSLELLQHPARVGSRDPLVLLDEFEAGRLTFQVHDRSAGAQPDLRHAVWEVVRDASTDSKKVFRYARPDGVVFRKTIEAEGGDYVLRGSLAVENRNAERLVPMWLEIAGAAGVVPEGGAYYVNGLAAYESEGRFSLSTGSGPSSLVDKPQEVQASDGKSRLRWLGTGNKYFAAVLVPEPAAWGDFIRFADYQGVANTKAIQAERDRRARALGRPLAAEELDALRKEKTEGVVGVFHLREFPLAAGATREFAWRFYAGPKEPRTLRPYAALGLDVLVDYGFLSIRRVMLWMLLLFESLTGNFGIAIILLTIAVRLVLFPISRKAQVSMFRMQKLTPQLKALQERFKEDRQRLTAETMKLYKQNKVSPMGGCLPLLLQLPIFIGLYNTLLFSIELRQSPFVGWIRDLSEPDRFCRLGLGFGPEYLNLLPILMLVPMVVQSLVTPKPADPNMAQQQKLMTWMMPALFLWMCYTMPSGVSLYWFFSSLWGLGEIRLIKKVWLRDVPSAGGAAASVPAAARR